MFQYYTKSLSYNRREKTLIRTLIPEVKTRIGDEITYQNVSENEMVDIAKSGQSIISALRNHWQTSASLNYTL